MAQRSLPQAGSGVGDAGPYTSDEWAEYFQITYTGDQEATQGPLRRYLNELVVSRLGLTITTGTGAGFVYGHFLVNDAALDIVVALAAAGLERYDRVVMVQNDTAFAYNTNLALPAAYAAGIPRNSARIAILQGAEAGAAVLPALITGAGGIYMVELARYLVTDAAVGSIDDRRDFCLFSSSRYLNTREVFVMPYISYNLSDATSPLGCYNSRYGLMMLNNKESHAVGVWIIPPNWDEEDITFTAVVDPDANGNVYSRTGIYAGACSEDVDLGTNVPGFSAVAVTAGENNCIVPNVQSNVWADPGDIQTLVYVRNASNVLDTVEDTVAFRGWIVSYGVR